MKVGWDETKLSQLQYVDDTLFIGEWSLSNMLNLEKNLKCFQLGFRLKASLSKNKVFGIGTSEVEVAQVAALFNYGPGCALFKYLGMLVVENHKRFAS